jgi:tetratricopeptide (TPR) repeat protein
MTRSPAIHHCTSQPFRFFGRHAELALLEEALNGGEPSVIAMIGPGGQGKTAIVQHWLSGLLGKPRRSQTEIGNEAGALIGIEDPAGATGHCDGIFLWSFYRGKDSDLCLREMLAYAEGLDKPPDVAASYCVDKLVSVLQRERWAFVLDGAEVVQHEQGAWFGRFVHPELGRLLEDLGSVAIPGVVVLTSRFPVPTLGKRRFARIVSLSALDTPSSAALLESLGVRGGDAVCAAAAQSCGLHAKAVELFGTFLVRYRHANGECYQELPELAMAGASEEENHVARVLQALQEVMPAELQDILALATSFRQPATEKRLLEYLRSQPLYHLLHETWGRSYPPLNTRSLDWLQAQVQTLVDLRLLERVSVGASWQLAPTVQADQVVLDAHPLVRRGFEHVLGPHEHEPEALATGPHEPEALATGHLRAHRRREIARTRAGFLRGRPDRQSPQRLEEAREEVELFHAYADAGLWNEADSTFVALDNPKHRFLAPAFERDLLLRFFPQGDWRREPLWPGFGRFRSLAISFEMLGQFEDAIDTYRPADAPLRGDALIALGRLQPFLEQPQAAHPWQTLWQAYRAHALCLLGQAEEALKIAQTLVPVDIYEWVHVFECLLRLGKLEAIDLRSLLYRPPLAQEHRWSQLARDRMRLDYLRVRVGNRSTLRAGSVSEGIASVGEAVDLGKEYRALLEAYDRAGLPFERVLTRLSYARLLLVQKQNEQARAVNAEALRLCRRFEMAPFELDCLALQAEAGYASDPREVISEFDVRDLRSRNAVRQ